MTNIPAKETQPIAKRTDCFAYHTDKDCCTALKDLYCKREHCSFYKPRKSESHIT